MEGSGSVADAANDVASFSCGAQLDITTVRTRSRARSSRRSRDASRYRLRSRRGEPDSTTTKYVVYYDGSTADGKVCGQGGSDSSGFGAAIVYYRSCVGVSTAGVAAHEVLHTFGAVSPGAERM